MTVPVDNGGLTQTTVQLTVSPVLYAIALQPDDPCQLRDAVGLACGGWGGIRFPWLPLAEDGTVKGGAEKLCAVLDVAGIIDLTRSDAREPVPTGLESLGLDVAPLANWQSLGLPVRGVLAPTAEGPLVTAGEMDDADVDPTALLGLGYLSPGERAAWEQAGQEVFVAAAGDHFLPQLDARTAVGVTATAVDDFIGTTMFGMTTALVWVLPDNFTLAEVADDLAMFWNFRALRLQHRGTVTVLTRLSSLREEEAGRRLAQAVSATALSTPTCVFNGVAVGEEQLRDTAERLGFRVIPVNDEWKERRYVPEEPVELTAVVDHPMGGWWLRDRHTGAIGEVMAVAGGRAGRPASRRRCHGDTPTLSAAWWRPGSGPRLSPAPRSMQLPACTSSTAAGAPAAYVSPRGRPLSITSTSGCPSPLMSWAPRWLGAARDLRYQIRAARSTGSLPHPTTWGYSADRYFTR